MATSSMATSSMATSSMATSSMATSSMAISWDEYFMGLAILSSQRSKDPSRKVGAIIINNDKKILSIGYNGFPKTVQLSNDLVYPWTKDEKELYVVHAEENCILNGHVSDYNNTTMYCTLFPCHKCAQSIIQVGIKNLIYLDEKEDSATFMASRNMFSNARINIKKYNQSNNEITLKL